MRCSLIITDRVIDWGCEMTYRRIALQINNIRLFLAEGPEEINI